MNVGIVGFGKMGAPIFRLIASRSYEVTVVLRDREKAKKQEKKYFRGLERSLRRGAVTEDEYLRQKKCIRFTDRLEDLARADLVIEAVIENYQEKVDIFGRLESIVRRDAALVSNTSFLSIAELARTLKHRERFCGLHFFYPVLLIGLVEIIRADDTPDDLVRVLKEFCGRIGKQSIVVSDTPGSVINFILGFLYIEALYILGEGLALPSKIDDLAKRVFYVGPCESIDVIGIDLMYRLFESIFTPESLAFSYSSSASRTDLLEKFREDLGSIYVPLIFKKLRAENRLGKRVSKGIYLYEKDGAIESPPEYYSNSERFRAVNDPAETDELIAMRLLYSIFNGSLYFLKKKNSSMEELNLGVKEILHMKEGPFSMMRTIGKKKVQENFDFLTLSQGERFRQKNLDLLEP